MSLPRQYFEQLYGATDDPWSFRTRPYEERKRRLTMACLPNARYRSVFEPGCAFGLLTGLLAERAQSVLAMDISEAAIRAASQVVPGHVELRVGAIPADWPSGAFDLVVLSEVGYYLDAATCARMAQLAMTTSTDIIAVHWRHPVADYPLGGDQVHALLDDAAAAHGRVLLVDHVEDDLRLGVWSRDGRSVAVRTGLIADPAADL
jgi:SAM-dependent methyltransferase